jgi:hypothetical protein
MTLNNSAGVRCARLRPSTSCILMNIFAWHIIHAGKRGQAKKKPSFRRLDF